MKKILTLAAMMLLTVMGLSARKREKVTQQELAQRVGTNKSYISRIENGSVEPGAGMFLRILSALGLRFEVSQPLAFG